MKLYLFRSGVSLYALMFSLCLLSSLYSSSQGRTSSVTGTVLGNNNAPLPGVSVLIRNQQTKFSSGTSSDSSGVFTLAHVPAGSSYILSFSAVGYQTQDLPGYTVKEGESLSIEVSLKGTVANLDQVVVVGYGTQRRKDVTGSVASIDTKNLGSLPVPNAGEAIEGKAAGVQVISSGSPGSNVTFRIRGTGTINNSDPLIVIDGVPTDAPLNNINSNDIASIDILKDASASAIYGSRGANGVVLVTTKKGTNGKGHLAFNFFSGWQTATHLVKMLNATQFAKLNNELLTNGNQATNPAFANPDTLGVGTDWLGALFRTAPMQNYSLSYSGGSDKYNYYVSGGVLNQQGIVINTSYKRYTVQFNSQAKVTDWIQFGNNITLTADNKPSGSYDIRSTMAANPVQTIYNKDGTYSNVLGNALWYGDITNQVGTSNINQNVTKGYNLLGNVFAEISLLPGLKFKTSAGLQANFYDSRSWAPVYNFQPNPQTAAYLSQQYNKALTSLWDNFITYDKSFGEHHLTVLAGSSAQNNRYDYISGNRQNFPSDVTQQLNSGTGTANVGGDASEWALLSFMGRVNYAYEDKYLVTATVRRDGSSRFGANNKYGTFPSASVAWRISKEKFFNVPFINDLKLRAGYGITGNQNIGNYSFAANLSIAQYNFNNTPVSIVYPLVLPNPGVQWEQQKQSNIGLDATILNNRVNITVDAYLKNTTKMLVPAVVPVTTGYSSTIVPSVNAGSLENKGIEITLSTRNLVGPFTWNTDFNISFNQNKIKSLNNNTALFVDNYGLNANFGIDQAGHPANEFYGYVTDGIFQTQKDVENHAVQIAGTTSSNSTSPGDIRFKDLNSDGVINADDRTYIGNPNPKFIYAMNNSFAYKGFDLTVFLQGVYGNKVFNANNINQESMSIAENQTTRTLYRWEGPGTSDEMPRAIYGDPNQNTRVSTRYIMDGSYLRIKNITVGYTFSRAIAQSLHFSSIRAYASCQNIATFTHYPGFDPEVGANGVDYSVYPVTRTISVGVNLNL